MLKAPTGKDDIGTSTGKPDFSLDLIVSKEANKMVEVSGFGGYEFRGRPDGFDLPSGACRWGAGFTFPSRNFFRAVCQLIGELPSQDSAPITSAAVVGVG